MVLGEGGTKKRKIGVDSNERTVNVSAKPLRAMLRLEGSNKESRQACKYVSSIRQLAERKAPPAYFLLLLLPPLCFLAPPKMEVAVGSEGPFERSGGSKKGYSLYPGFDFT